MAKEAASSPHLHSARHNRDHETIANHLNEKFPSDDGAITAQQVPELLAHAYTSPNPEVAVDPDDPTGASA